MNHAERLEWRTNGQCYYRVHKKRKCTGTPGYSGGCPGTYMDDYGSMCSCPECNGSGVVRYNEYVRLTEFDAPRPKKGWEPAWIES